MSRSRTRLRRRRGLAALVLVLLVCVVVARAWANNLYVQNIAPDISTMTVKGTWGASCSGTPIERQMAPWKAGAYSSTTMTKNATTNPMKCRTVTWVSNPITGGALSGNVKFILATAESNAAANATSYWHIRSQICYSDNLVCLKIICRC